MFKLETFLVDLAQFGPAIISGVMGLKNEVHSVSKTQLASDSAHLALGVTAALTHNDPAVVADAQTASTIINAITATIAAHTGQVIQ